MKIVPGLLLLALLGTPGSSLVLTDGTHVTGEILCPRLSGGAFELVKGDTVIPIPARFVRSLSSDSPPDTVPVPKGLDRVHLRDGGIVSGRILNAGEKEVRMRVGTREISYPRSLVTAIERAPILDPTSRQKADEAIRKVVSDDANSLKEAVASLRDLGEAVLPVVRAALVSVDLPPRARTALEALLPTRTSRSRRLPRGGLFSLLRNPTSALGFLATKLGLSAEQEPKVLVALHKLLTASSAARAAFRRGDRKGAAAFRSAIAVFRGEMKKILTDVQFRKFEQILPRRRR